MTDPDEPELTAAFVARLWPDVRGLRARIRHTIDLSRPEVEATTSGTSDAVISDLVDRFTTWAKEFASAARRTEEDPPDAVRVDPLTPQ